MTDATIALLRGRSTEELIAEAGAYAEELGRTPTKIELRRRLRIGHIRAGEILAAFAGTDEEDGAEEIEDEPEEQPQPRKRAPAWPVILLTLPALAVIWSGWVSLGTMRGFGVVHPLPGIADHVTFNTAITLPIGMETYASYALYVWLSGRSGDKARRFARTSAIVALAVGALGQTSYHLLNAAGTTHAPWPITVLVSCIPLAVLGMGAALAHLVRSGS